MLVEQLLVLGPWQPGSHCTQCANCCVHNIGIPVQVDLQQKTATVMASSERSWQASCAEGLVLQTMQLCQGSRGQFRGSAAAHGPIKAIEWTTANETVLWH